MFEAEDSLKRNNAGLRFFSLDEAETTAGIKQQQVSRWRNRLAKPDKYRDQLVGSLMAQAMAEKMEHRVEANSGDFEWYTPAEYILMARNVLGAIDLDPASSHLANRTVQATRFFSSETNGLGHSWDGRVWMNPPYTYPLISQFAEKLVEEYLAGHVTAAVVLTNDCTDTGWFHTLATASAALCFLRGRIRFVRLDGEKSTPTQGQTFFYFGQETDRFANVFGDAGFIAEVRR
jgi:ParB family chromosome partitioning protein